MSDHPFRTLVEMARAAQHDDRQSTGDLYRKLADRIEALEAALRGIVNGGTMVLLTASMDECQVNPDVLEQIINDARAALAPETKE